MSKYTAEQVEEVIAGIRSRAITVSEKANVLSLLADYAATLRQQTTNPHEIASKLVGDGAVSALTDHAMAVAAIPSKYWDRVREAVAPLLRAPAEQGGRVDESCTNIDSPFNACMYRDHCRSMQAALAQNAQGEAVATVEGDSVRWHAIVPAGTKLYLHAERQNAHRDVVPEGTPMMPPGTFFDGCWKRLPESLQSYGRMLTQSWRMADSNELKIALEAGVLALEVQSSKQQRETVRISAGKECQYRSLSLPDADGDRVWLPWQQFGSEMEIRHPAYDHDPMPAFEAYAEGVNQGHAERARVPDGWSGWCTQYPDRLPKLWGARVIAELNYYPEEGQRMFQVVEVAAAPSLPTHERVFTGTGYLEQTGYIDPSQPEDAA